MSDVDIQFLSNYKWYFSGGYLRNGKLGIMQRVILERMLDSKIPQGMQVDHINGKKLDNRRENLRLATQSENQANSSARIGIYGLKGVQPHRRKWQARIQKNKKRIYIGLYDTKEEAGLAYNKKAIELFGEFANLNKIS